MAKVRIVIDLDKEVFDTLHSLRNTVLEDEGLVFFRNNTESQQSWFRYVLSMGLVKVKSDFKKWKKAIEDESD